MARYEYTVRLPKGVKTYHPEAFAKDTTFTAVFECPDLPAKNPVAKHFQDTWNVDLVQEGLGRLATKPVYEAAFGSYRYEGEGKDRREVGFDLIDTDPAAVQKRIQAIADEYKAGNRTPGKAAETKRKAGLVDEALSGGASEEEIKEVLAALKARKAQKK